MIDHVVKRYHIMVYWFPAWVIYNDQTIYILAYAAKAKSSLLMLVHACI